MLFKNVRNIENLFLVSRVLCITVLSGFLSQVLSFSAPLNTFAESVQPFADPVPSVAVNKYFNSGTPADVVELLVIQNNLDMRGMILKDFSSSMANDTGGKFTFADNPLWASVPAGTLVVLRNDSSAADVTDGGGDFNLDLGLTNTTYFTNSGGTFDIATIEMVMIKSAGSGVSGVTGSIHALAGGTPGTQFTSAPTPKLIASGSSGSNQFVFANNSTQSVADFNGTDAIGSASGLTFGTGNNADNTAFINSLRGGVGPTPTPTPSGSPTPTPTPSPTPVPHDPNEHLVMGNPTAATTDINTPLNYLMKKTQYCLSYNNDKGTTNWTSWHLDSSWLGGTDRTDDFRSDDTLPVTFKHVSSGYNFATYGFDRGHMTPSADRTNSLPDNSATFLMTNMIPQASGNNQGPWANLEGYIRTQLNGTQNEEYIISGPWGIGGNSSTGHWDTIQDTGGNTVTVPQLTWKVIMVLPNGSGDDVSRVTTSTRTFAVIMPNNDNIRSDDWKKYLATVHQVEALTGYDFFSNVPPNIQAVIESEVDDVNDTAPVANNQNVITSLNTPKAIMLTASDFNINNVLTYTVVSNPQHGALSGTPPSLTYSPDAAYGGTDSFTFVANDGDKNSNTATVTMGVLAPTPTPTPTPSPTPTIVATVTGRVVSPDMRGLRNTTVSMTDANNVVRTATTSSFGFFSFDNVALGQQYSFRVQSRLYRYSPATVTVNDNLALPDFVGLE